MNEKKIDRLEILLNSLVQLLQGIERWKNYAQHTKESVLEHTLKICTLGMIACLMEKKTGRTDIDFLKVMMALLVHDWGEGQIGDVTWTVKNDPRLKKIMEEIEKEKLTVFLSAYLPGTLIKDINGLIDLQHDISPSGKFFRAIEILGYITYALHEIEEYGHKEFITGVLKIQYEPMEECAKQFASIKTIWIEMKPKVEKILKIKKNPFCS